ncbi:MAG TPA: hypothetical protein VJ598_02760, partial [Albitalea sp.]|nr:hypothetical protein [Albitalea sp.]
MQVTHEAPTRHLVAMTWIVIAASIAAVAIDLAGCQMDASAAPPAAPSVPVVQGSYFPDQYRNQAAE